MSSHISDLIDSARQVPCLQLDIMQRKTLSFLQSIHVTTTKKSSNMECQLGHFQHLLSIPVHVSIFCCLFETFIKLGLLYKAVLLEKNSQKLILYFVSPIPGK